MKNLYKNLSILLICFIIGSCIVLFQSKIYIVLVGKILNCYLTNKTPKVQYVLADENSKPLNHDKYDSIYLSENGYFIVSKNSKYGIIDNNGKTKIPLKYSNISCRNNGYFVAQKTKMPKYDYIISQTAYDNNAKLKSHKYYFFDTNTCKLILTLNSQKTPIIYNKDLIEISQKGKNVLINKRGKNLIKGNYEDIIVLSGYRYSDYDYRHLKYGKLERLLQKIKRFCPNRSFVSEIEKFDKKSNDLNIKIKRKGKWGVINLQNEIIIPCEYDEIYTDNFDIYPKDDVLKFKVKNNGKYGIINIKGEIIVPVEYDEIGSVATKNLSVKKNGKWGIIDYNNNILFDFISESKVIYFKSTIFIVSKIKEPEKQTETTKIKEPKEKPPVKKIIKEIYKTEGDLHVVGVYEGQSDIQSGFMYHPSGRVDVNVKIVNKPITLVLSAYEPVLWKISAVKGANIKKIYISGYYDGDIILPNPNISVEKINKQLVDNENDSKFVDKFDKAPSSIQYKYSGTVFNIEDKQDNN